MKSKVTLFRFDEDEAGIAAVELSLHVCRTAATVVGTHPSPEAKEDSDEACQKFVADYTEKEASSPESSKIAEMLKGYWRIVCLPVGGTRMSAL